MKPEEGLIQKGSANSQPESPSLRREVDFALLDQLRGIAALGVVVAHARGVLFVGGARLAKLLPWAHWTFLDKVGLGLLQLTRLGPEYVIFFFVLSGFSIAYSLNERSNLKDFYLRRALRLYPTYLGALVWAIFVFALTRWWRPDFYSGVYDHVTFAKLAASRDFLGPSVVLRNLIYLPSGLLVAPFWSLTFEVIFYALAPLFLARRRYYYVLSIAAYGAGWLLEGWGFGQENILKDFVLTYNIYFMIGIAVFYDWKRVRQALHMQTTPLALLTGTLFLSAVAFDYKLGGLSKFSFALFAGLAVILMANVHTHDWRSKICGFLGNMSYTLYVTHFASIILLLAIVHAFIPAPYILSKALWLAGIPFSLAWAWGFYWLIEKRTRKALSMLRQRREA